MKSRRALYAAACPGRHQSMTSIHFHRCSVFELVHIRNLSAGAMHVISLCSQRSGNQKLTRSDVKGYKATKSGWIKFCRNLEGQAVRTSELVPTRYRDVAGCLTGSSAMMHLPVY